MMISIGLAFLVLLVPFQAKADIQYGIRSRHRIERYKSSVNAKRQGTKAQLQRNRRKLNHQDDENELYWMEHQYVEGCGDYSSGKAGSGYSSGKAGTVFSSGKAGSGYDSYGKAGSGYDSHGKAGSGYDNYGKAGSGYGKAGSGGRRRRRRRRRSLCECGNGYGPCPWDEDPNLGMTVSEDPPLAEEVVDDANEESPSNKNINASGGQGEESPSNKNINASGGQGEESPSNKNINAFGSQGDDTGDGNDGLDGGDRFPPVADEVVDNVDGGNDSDSNEISPSNEEVDRHGNPGSLIIPGLPDPFRHEVTNEDHY